jgi:hypothetical protein
MSDSEIVIYNNNILDKTIKDAPTFDPTKALTEEDKANFLKNYKEHFWNTQVKHTQDLLKEDSSVQTFQDPEQPKADKEDKDSKKTESIKSIVKRIGDTKPGDIADFTYNGRKIAYDGGNFLVERTTGLKDLVFTTKEDVINYLKTGGTSKPKLRGK